MQPLDDIGLLREYATRNSQTAFETLVSQRIGFVYSAALRQVGDPHVAEEVTQAVFIILAQNASKISDKTILAGWLFKTTRFVALGQIRAAAKRRRQEQELRMQEETETTPPEPIWEQLSPLVDEALGALGEKDRQAVLLRFFENKSLAEVGISLGTGEDTARKRVGRALEKLHRFFARRGIGSTTTLLAEAISAYSVHAAPAALAKTVTAAAVAKGAIAGGSTLTLLPGALKIMAWSKAQTAAVSLVVVGATTFSVVQHQGQVRLRNENQSLRQQMDALQADNERLTNLLAQAPAAPTPPVNHELLRLRGEVGVLRQETNELKSRLAKTQRPEMRQPGSAAEQQSTEPLPADYPKTADGATKGIFEAFSQGDLNSFLTKFAEPGVPHEMYQKMFNDPAVSNYLSGLKVLSVGEPTNSFGLNMWFVPYRIQFRDGNVKEFRLHVAQDPNTQRWFFKGGI